MKPAVRALHDVWVFILSVVRLVLSTHVPLAPFHIADHGEGKAAVLGQRNGYRAAQTRPGSHAGCRAGCAGRVVGNGDSAALQLDRTDAGIVVGQNGGHRCSPGISVVHGFASVDMVGRAASHERSQMSRLQLHHIGVNRAVALRHIHGFPGLSLVIGNAECGGITCQAQLGVGTDPVTENPASTLQHLDGLSAEAALLRKYGLVIAPGLSPIRALLTADHRGKLHVVLAFHPGQLGSVHSPHFPVGAGKQGRILLASVRIVGD